MELHIAADGNVVADRLTAIVGYARLLERAHLSETERREYGSLVCEQAQALYRLLTKDDPQPTSEGLPETPDEDGTFHLSLGSSVATTGGNTRHGQAKTRKDMS